MSLFQDASGTVPALLPGDPVGLITRAAGTVNAAQATQASKPTLGRWPKGGRRNLLLSTEDLGISAWAKQDTTAAGLQLRDTTANTSHILRWSPSAVPAGKYTVSFECRAVGAVTSFKLLVLPSTGGSGSRNFNLITGEVTAGSTATPSTASLTALSNGWWRVVFSFEAAHALGYWDLRMNNTWPIGNDIYTGDGLSGLDLRNIQFEAGAVATPYQKVTTALDVTEAGVAPVWHLWNDGGDSLPVTLPAGECGLAWVDVLGAVTVTTVTSDGTTPINLLRSLRMADVLIRQGALSAVEINELTAYWERLYK